MAELILPILYSVATPIATPIVAYYTLKYATNIAVDIAIYKTKNICWYIITYPFSKKEVKCIKCECIKCTENLFKEEINGYEILDLTDVKEKID